MPALGLLLSSFEFIGTFFPVDKKEIISFCLSYFKIRTLHLKDQTYYLAKVFFMSFSKINIK